MEKTLVPVSIAVETNSGSKGERESYLLVTFKIADGGAEQFCRLKVDYDIEFAARLEEAMREKEGVKMVIG